MTINATELAAKINEMTEVETANAWTKVAGKERIYIELIRTDRAGKRYGGSGGKVYIDLNTGKLVTGTNGYNHSPFFNSFTKDFHEDADTLSKIEALI